MKQLIVDITENGDCHLCTPHIKKLLERSVKTESGNILNPRVDREDAIVLTPNINAHGITLGYHVAVMSRDKVTKNLEDKPKPVKEFYCLEWLSSEIYEDHYEEGEKDHTGCGIPHLEIGKRFDSKEAMLKYVEQTYCFEDFEDEEGQNGPGFMNTSKMVADHSNKQNGGWFEPSESETEKWKKGEMKLYSERVTLKFHTFDEEIEP